jgi:hypothetical protein
MRNVVIFTLASIVVLAGVAVGVYTFSAPNRPEGLGPESVLSGFSANDGQQYIRITTEGYYYNGDSQSTIKFFPAYPLIASVVARLAGMEEQLSLVIVANGCFALALIVFWAYLRGRGIGTQSTVSHYVVIAIGTWPVTMFFRMAYSESLFLLVAIVAFYGMQRQWPKLIVAFLIGFGTAVRPVGIAMCPVLIWWIWTERRASGITALQTICCLLISVWGVFQFALYQYEIFGDAFLFSKSQEISAASSLAWHERLLRSIVLEPIWSKYIPSSPAYWARHDPDTNPLFSLDFANPIYFVVTVGLIAYGRYRKWIDDKETLFSAGVLAISYFAQGHRFMMMSQGRFAATCFPVYIVMGHLLARMPPPLASLLVALSACMLFAYSALFATWHRIY